MKILCLTPLRHISSAWAILNECGQVFYHPDASKPEAESLLKQFDPEVVYVNPNRMGYRLEGPMLNESLKFVCTASTGTDHIDLTACEQKGIQVISLTTDYETLERISSTAEMAFALMMSLIRNIPKSFDSVKNGHWDYEPYMGHQISGFTVGIVGYGRLGRMMCRYCRAFGMEVLISDPVVTDSIDLHEIFQRSDVVSLHVHLNKETRHMIDQAVLSHGSAVYLINTSRGAIVAENDVIRALESGQLAGYATDVLEDELTDISRSELVKRSEDLNIIVTPHLGGSTFEGQAIAYARIAERLRKALQCPS